jgi:hypothetical protein
LTLRTLTAKIEIIGDCNKSYQDSMDIYMHFRDKNHKPLMDGRVIKRMSVEEREMHLSARLLKSDEWKIDTITNRFGKDFCESTYCQGDTLICRNKTRFTDYLPVDSMQLLRVNCSCRISFD